MGAVHDILNFVERTVGGIIGGTLKFLKRLLVCLCVWLCSGPFVLFFSILAFANGNSGWGVFLLIIFLLDCVSICCVCGLIAFAYTRIRAKKEQQSTVQVVASPTQPQYPNQYPVQPYPEQQGWQQQQQQGYPPQQQQGYYPPPPGQQQDPRATPNLNDSGSQPTYNPLAGPPVGQAQPVQPQYPPYTGGQPSVYPPQQYPNQSGPPAAHQFTPGGVQPVSSNP
eukprot:TRINITY_DN30167_c0_g1_i1.p1 TRINITY_DN30167_c0_g1~~TRINITY_DN30167_c0_g1_i1.p1  ORF type:complete len:224 (-),score=28.55 TRINITY_DN30167_c0_g1_i1:244-915(-)